MYIDNIKLHNIRGFQNLEFNFKRPNDTYAGWTVFTGDNGSGKSTLLKAIAIGLVGKDIARSLQPSFHRWIGNGATEGSIQLNIMRTKGDDKTNGGKSPSAPFPSKIIMTNGGRETVLQAVTPPGKKNNYTTSNRTIWSNNANGWFSCGYGPFRRIFGASSEAMQQMITPTTARFATMFQEAASLSEADRWLRDLNHKKLENRQAEREQLDVLLAILKDELMPNQIIIDRVDSDGLWLKDRKGVNLAWSEMSDGYRAALALLIDILRHLINIYGIDDLTQKDANGHIVIKRSGVVLIDEIDAHLHPEWQREIGFWLKRHFPQIQFLVTTHSPIICQAADLNGLFVLPEPGSDIKPYALPQQEYETVIASRPDTILRTSAFGLQNTRSPLAVANRIKFAKLEAKKRASVELTPEEDIEQQHLKLFAIKEEEL